MPEILSWMLAVAAGLLLGAIFFGGLWWTVRKGPSSRRPALWFATSLLLRMGVAMAGIYWVGREIGPAIGKPSGQLSWQLSWQPLLLCLLGFVLARPLVLRLTRPRPPTHSATETGHAA